MIMTLNDLYIALRKRFKNADLYQPELEARELVAVAAHADKRHTANWAHMYLSEDTLQTAEELAERRLGGEPLAYLLGEWDFYGLTFKVNQNVLIPRPETELLCDFAIEYTQKIVNPCVLDLCCGSGCIGIALLKQVEDARVTALDISEDALSITRENAVLHGVSGRLTAIQASAMELPMERLGRFHLLVSNPPYVTEEEMQTLDSSVRDYEPELALYGGKDGLDFYRSIAARWRRAMLPDGMLMVECGWKQAESIQDLLLQNGWRNVGIREDLSSIPRIVYATAPLRTEL